MARKAKEFTTNTINLDMLDTLVARVNSCADSIRDSYDMEEVGMELTKLYMKTERGLEHIDGKNDEFAFTMVCRAIPMDGRHRKQYEYKFRFNTMTNEVTCIDEQSLAWTMPLLTDALAVIREKTIQVAFS
jgi:hypothetical protein